MTRPNYQNFAITDDALIFYFAQGELLPSFAGATQVQVPRNAIPPLAHLTPAHLAADHNVA